MSASSALSLQSQIRHQAEEQFHALKDLTKWEDSIKEKDKGLCLKSGTKPKSRPTSGVVGNRVSSGGHTREEWSTAIDTISSTKVSTREEKLSLSSEEKIKNSSLSDANDYNGCNYQASECDEDSERLKGNKFYSMAKYGDAIISYTKCIQMNPQSVLSYSNRAMAYLKLKEWKNAENDASIAITMDPSHMKSYHRRAVARKALGKFRASLQDLNKASLLVSKEFTTSNTDSKSLNSFINEINKEMKKVENALSAAIRRAPKRNLDIQVVETELKSNELLKNDIDGVRKDVTMDKEVTRNPSEGVNRIIHKEIKTKDITNWCTFEHSWKFSDREGKVSLLNNLGSSRFHALYKNGIEDCDILYDIIDHLEFVTGRIDFISVISEMQSIDMIVMMMTSQQQKTIRSKIQDILNDNIDSPKAKKIMTRLFR